MPDFNYQAINPTGRRKEGRIAAASELQAREILAGKNFYVIHLGKADREKTIAGGSVFRRRPAKLGQKDLALLTRQLASLIRVSPVEEALRTVSRQTEKAHIRLILDNVRSGIAEGQRLSESLRREADSFPSVYTAMVAAGESSGALPEILERLAHLLERQAETRNKLLSALSYPIILTIVALVVVAGLMISVVPRIVEQFDDVNQQLPFITRAVMAVSAFLATWWWIIILAAISATAVFMIALRQPGFRIRVDGLIINLPFLGKLVRDMNAARFARTLATMVASRLPLLEALKLCRNIVSNQILRRTNDNMAESVRRGGSLSNALRDSGHFPPLLVYLAASGESAGQLDLMLTRAAEYLEREFDTFTTTALSMLEPVIIVVMGGIVAFIILSILLPILQLQNLAGI